MDRFRQMVLIGGLLCILLLSGSGLAIPVSAHPANPGVSPNTVLRSPAAAVVQIATACQYDITTNTQLIR